MSDEQHGHIFLFGISEKARGAFAHLTDAACRRLYGIRGYCLYGVHNKELRLYLGYVLEDGLKGGFCDDVAVVAHAAYAVCPEFDLHGALFSGDIEYAAALDGEYVL